MAKKKRCPECRNYYPIEKWERFQKYCSAECNDKARDKAFQKAKAKLDKKYLQKKTKPKVPKKKKQKSPYMIAKDSAWDVFSIYIRTRDCIRFTGKPDMGMCITCKRPYPFNKLQAGHFIPGRGNAVLFDERIVYSQCSGCNINPPYGLGGNYVEYFVFMEEEWGREKIDEFRKLRHTNVKFKTDELIQLKESYENKTKELLEKL